MRSAKPGMYGRQKTMRVIRPSATRPPVTADTTITVGMASIPSREEALERSLRSLLGQTWAPDAIHVYLNGYLAPPSFLARKPFRRVQVHSSQTSGDLGSLGKFWLPYPVGGYRFTCDDDIEYPANYCEVLIGTIELARRRAFVGVHGMRFHPPVKSYVRDRILLPFQAADGHDRLAHVLGTGTLAWHTSTFDPTPAHFMFKNMDDPQLASMLHDRGIPRITVARGPRWLKSISTDRAYAIGTRTKKDDRLETRFVQRLSWSNVDTWPLPATG